MKVILHFQIMFVFREKLILQKKSFKTEHSIESFELVKRHNLEKRLNGEILDMLCRNLKGRMHPI